LRYDIEITQIATRGANAGSGDGKVYVLEVNTSPTLASSDYSMQRYAMYFDWLMRSDTRREHWNTDEFKKAKSFAWKNFQLRDEANPKGESKDE